MSRWAMNLKLKFRQLWGQLPTLRFGFDEIPLYTYYVLYHKKVYPRWVNFERKQCDGLVNFTDFEHNFSRTSTGKLANVLING